MPGRTLILAAAALAAMAAAAQPALAKTKSPACTGRWVLDAGSKGLIFGEQTPTADALAVAPTQITVSPCGTTKASVKRTKNATKVSARFKTCGALKAVQIRATIPPDCATLSGTIKAKKVPTRSFTAKRATGCGDGVLDATGGEGCEVDGDCQAGDLCTACACGPIPTTTTTTTVPGSTVTTTTTSSTTTTTISLTCGDGTVDPGEICDDHNQVNGDGCDNNCTVSACGNGVVAPDETCDDGNTTNFDDCPATCVEEACTPTATPVTATVTWNAPAAVAGMTVVVDYPEGKVKVPGIGSTIAPGTFTGYPSGTSHAEKVLGNSGYAARVVVSKATAINPRPGTLFVLHMTTCQGAAAAVSGDFTCTVESAFAPDGITPVAATCAVSVP